MFECGSPSAAGGSAGPPHSPAPGSAAGLMTCPTHGSPGGWGFFSFNIYFQLGWIQSESKYGIEPIGVTINDAVILVNRPFVDHTKMKVNMTWIIPYLVCVCVYLHLQNILQSSVADVLVCVWVQPSTPLSWVP